MAACWPGLLSIVWACFSKPQSGLAVRPDSDQPARQSTVVNMGSSKAISVVDCNWVHLPITVLQRGADCLQ